MTELEEQLRRALDQAETFMKDGAITGAIVDGENGFACYLCSAQHKFRERIDHDKSCPINKVEQALKAAQERGDTGDPERVASIANDLYSRLLPYKTRETLPPEVVDVWDDFEEAIIAWREADNERT